jgi:Fe-S cluster biogenesis protein NfuA
VSNSRDFQEQVRHLGELVTRFEQMPDNSQKTAGRELLQLLMEVYGQGLERIMEIVFECDSGRALIDRLAKDEVAGGLLLLYSLHPDSLEARVQTALERMRPRLRKLACSIELLGIENGAVQVRVEKSGHSCGSSVTGVQAVIESVMYELVPDLTSLEVLGIEERPSTGFVALETLLGRSEQHTVQVGSGH